jgi:hypothetical protein
VGQVTLPVCVICGYFHLRNPYNRRHGQAASKENGKESGKESGKRSVPQSGAEARDFTRRKAEDRRACCRHESAA